MSSLIFCQTCGAEQTSPPWGCGPRELCTTCGAWLEWRKPKNLAEMFSYELAFRKLHSLVAVLLSADPQAERWQRAIAVSKTLGESNFPPELAHRWEDIAKQLRADSATMRAWVVHEVLFLFRDLTFEVTKGGRWEGPK